MKSKWNTRWLLGQQPALGALATLQAGEMCLQFAGIQATFAAAHKVFALAQMRLSLCCAVQGVGVAVLQLLALFQGDHGTQANPTGNGMEVKSC